MRRRSPDDRRKNIIELTPAGQDCLRQAEEARQEVELEFLAPLTRDEADQFVHTLQRLINP